MNKILNVLVIIIALNVSSKIEILDRVAVIVDDGVIMESQIKNTLTDIERRYVDQNIPMPPMNLLLEQITEKLIIEELQLQLADRAGVKISDSELNITVDTGKGYRALANISEHGGQEVPHLHFHLFGGEKIGKMVL